MTTGRVIAARARAWAGFRHVSAAGLLTLLWLGVAEAQVPAQPPSPFDLTTRPTVPSLPPMPPSWQSPVDFFRRLLAAGSAERETLLADKTPAQRQVFLNSLREYEALTPVERTNRLAALDLRSFLTPLLVLPASNRVARLRTVPETMRPMVEARLQAWDELSPESQKLVLQNEKVMRLVVAGDRGPERELNLVPLNSGQFKQLETDIARWRQMPAGTRERIYGQFQIIFDATDRQQQKAFAPLNAAELQQMRRALDNFRRLPRAQRDQCLDGFKKFTDLSAEERRQFLLNAEEWRRMEPEERRLWRQLVERMPPMPPGFGGPPLPPHAALPLLRPNAALVTTNTNR